MKRMLADVSPELINEWSQRNLPLTPDSVTHGSNKIVWWNGKCGHEWRASIKNRVISGSGCPYCSHNAILEGYNDLASQKPELAAEWSARNAPLLPTQVTVFANRKAWWRCRECGNEWKTLISTRSDGSKCPYCSGYILLKGFNDFATLYPQLAEEWSDRNLPLTPDTVNDKSRKNVWWKCRTCGYEWKSVIHSRAKGAMCPVCADRAVLTGYNDLATTDPHLLDEWDFDKNTDFLPEHISRQSMYSVWWKCPLNHSYKATISDRASGMGCKVCDKEYKSVLPKLAIMVYAGMKKMSAKFDDDSIIGIPLESYISEEKLAIETSKPNENEYRIKQHLCKKRNIKLVYVPYGRTDEISLLEKIKQAFRSVHIYINSDTEKDAEIIRQRFYDWRFRQSQSVIAQK
ncbi:MAG: zinc-ribbon domain-containing protein [Ruminococcus sp.]|nr:zinc-ribbon domain-containing protein [Ruminococcus sp.]